MQGLRGLIEPVRAALRGEQRKATVILAVSPLLMLTWKYFGSPDFYRTLNLDVPCLESLGGDATGAAVYHFAAALLLLGLIPAAIVKWVFREKLADYGVQLGNRRRTFRSLLIFAPVMVLLAYLSSDSPAMRAEYPINRGAGASPWMFAIHVATYLLMYLGWEFHFRGFLQLGLRGRLGDVNALLVQVMASGLLHIGKPTIETFAALGGGILWGVLAYRTRSLLSGLGQHFLLGAALDWFISFRPR